jgi:hypothetical protein
MFGTVGVEWRTKLKRNLKEIEFMDFESIHLAQD